MIKLSEAYDIMKNASHERKVELLESIDFDWSGLVSRMHPDTTLAELVETIISHAFGLEDDEEIAEDSEFGVWLVANTIKECSKCGAKFGTVDSANGDCPGCG